METAVVGVPVLDMGAQVQISNNTSAAGSSENIEPLQLLPRSGSGRKAKTLLTQQLTHFCYKGRKKCSIETKFYPLWNKRNKLYQHLFLSVGSTKQRIGSCFGRKWQILRNDPEWMFRYALVSEFLSSPSWKSLFRILHSIFMELVSLSRPVLEIKTHSCEKH